MALRDQPYLPLFVQDYLTDEKLSECSASSVGVFSKLMCLMHKSEPYGSILLKQKYKQTDEQNLKHYPEMAWFFACQVAKNLQFSVEVVAEALTELLAEDVIQISGEILSQKRMVRDGEISEKRASAGARGGKNTQKKIKEIKVVSSGLNTANPDGPFAKAKKKANTENEIEIENEIKLTDKVDENKNGVPDFSVTGFKPGPEDIPLIPLPEINNGMTVQMVKITKKRELTPAEVNDLFEVFKLQEFTGEKYYENVGKIYLHFLNWAKSQKYDNNGNSTDPNGSRTHKHAGKNTVTTTTGNDRDSGAKQLVAVLTESYNG